ncbi:hypothetical protein CSKR_113470 [Clonorchis sinensis]|uniref:Uncharacterized protein n=2 Tax=Clonorchis sinensis TaxID=79923 RepID=G7Y439_CLOSI|nr:hypothetical protein CSKR_113470 [Clonorchis sinensis]GAA47725.1 hypothetical protein CLF_100727 [Clonorchis sinensis]
MFSVDSVPICAGEMTVSDLKTDSHARSIAISTVSSVAPQRYTLAQQNTSMEVPASCSPSAKNLPPANFFDSTKPLDSLTTTTMASFLVPPPKPRSEYFYPDEIKLMLEEVGLRKHLLLSPSPSTNRLKRRAWEEVAANVAARWPHSARRTAEQVKKKWENLVSTTKRKIRAGHVTPELDWNETNSTIVEFLAQHSPLIKLRYANAWAQSQFGSYSFPTSGSSHPSNTTFNQDGTLTPDDTTQASVKCEPMVLANCVDPASNRDRTSQSAVEGGTDNPNCGREMDSMRTSREFQTPVGLQNSPAASGTSSVNSHSLLSANPFRLSAPGPGLSEPSYLWNCGPEIQRQLQEHLNREHSMRLEILSLQKRAWELQVELLQQALNEQSNRILNGSNSFVNR